MKKITLLMSMLIVATIAFMACAHTDNVKKDQKTNTTYNADYSVATDAPAVILASYETQPEVILTQAEADPADPAKKFDFSTILNIVLSVTGVILTGFMAKFKAKLSQLISLGQKVMAAGVEVDEALKDDNISKAEIAQIRSHALEIRDAFKELIAFKKTV
jgi:hypothetical protein